VTGGIPGAGLLDAGGAVSGVLTVTDVVTDVVSVVDEVVEEVSPPSPESPPHPVANAPTATAAAPANRTGLLLSRKDMPRGYPNTAALNRDRSAARDLAGLEAGGAHVDALLVAARMGDGAHGLDVRIPPTAGPAMGVRHRLAEAGALSADIAHGSHI
jgi:hypothetical protein